MLFVQLAGVGGPPITIKATRPARRPGLSRTMTGGDRDHIGRSTIYSHSVIRELLPYYDGSSTHCRRPRRWGRRADLLRGARNWIFRWRRRRTSRGRHSGRSRTPSCSPREPRAEEDDPERLVFPLAQRVHILRPLLTRVYRAPACAINLKAKRSTSVSYIPMALTCDLWSPTGKRVTFVADAFASAWRTRPRRARASPGASARPESSSRRKHAPSCSRAARSRRRALAEQRPAESERLGGTGTDRPFRRRSSPGHALRHGVVARAGFQRAHRLSRRRHARSRRRDSRVSAVLTHSATPAFGCLRQRPSWRRHGADTVGRLIGLRSQGSHGERRSSPEHRRVHRRRRRVTKRL